MIDIRVASHPFLQMLAEFEALLLFNIDKKLLVIFK